MFKVSWQAGLQSWRYSRRDQHFYAVETFSQIIGCATARYAYNLLGNMGDWHTGVHLGNKTASKSFIKTQTGGRGSTGERGAPEACRERGIGEEAMKQAQSVAVI